jgi:hypothetical protein
MLMMLSHNRRKFHDSAPLCRSPHLPSIAGLLHWSFLVGDSLPCTVTMRHFTHGFITVFKGGVRSESCLQVVLSGHAYEKGRLAKGSRMLMVRSGLRPMCHGSSPQHHNVPSQSQAGLQYPCVDKRIGNTRFQPPRLTDGTMCTSKT